MEPIIGLLVRVKAAVRGFKQSNVQVAYLKKAQEQVGAPQHALIQSNQTRCVFASSTFCLLNTILLGEWIDRWNSRARPLFHARWSSHHDMAARFAEQRVAIAQAYNNDQLRNTTASNRVFDDDKKINPHEMRQLVDLTAVLDPFRHVTTELQSAGVTSSIALPSIMKLQAGLGPRGRLTVVKPMAGTEHPEEVETKEVSELDHDVQGVAYHALADMRTRFVLRRMMVFAAAACLDPRVKVRAWEKRKARG